MVAQGASGDETAETVSPARRLLLAGSDSILWLISGEWDGNEETFNRRLLYREPGTDRIQPVTVATHAQRVGVIGVAGQTLHVFYTDGTHARFNKKRRWAGHQLPNEGVPVAVAGEGNRGKSRVWALVTPDLAQAVDAAWRERQAREAAENRPWPAPERGASEVAISALPLPEDKPKRHRLVVYDGVIWQPGIPVPETYTATEQVWLVAENGRFHLFWAAEDNPREIRYARYDGVHWGSAASIALPGDIRSACVAVANKHLVLAALIKEPDLASASSRCLQWSRALAAPVEESWDAPAELLDEQGQPMVLPAGSALGLFSDRLAVMRFGEGEPEIGLWAAGAGGKPDQPFAPIPAASSREGAAPRHGARDLAATLIVAAVLLMLFWKRQETIASPLELPADLQIAGPARRGFAFLIDAAPAAALVWWVWSAPISSFLAELHAAAQAGEPMREAPSQALWAWFWFRVIYTTWCTLFEAFTASTPGKRLMGCFVMSESLARATFLQIVIRNVSRMIELEPFLKIWPFMLIIFFTRNRQRLGDLLAHTVVVERQTSVVADEDAEEESERMREDQGR
jgi:uncharacterized RDD family membrane protein YckC